MFNSNTNTNLFHPQQTPSINLFNPSPMNSSTNLFTPSYQPSNNQGMTLRSGNTTSNNYGSNSTTPNNFFPSNLTSKNLLSNPNQPMQSTNNNIFTSQNQNQNRPTDVFSGMGGMSISTMGNNMANIGSVSEKFDKLNFKYYRANETDKNLYHGTILAQNKHKEKSLEMVRLEDYSLIRQLNVPDEVKGILKKCILERTFNEQVIKEEVRHLINSPSTNAINPNIFSVNQMTSFPNSNLNQNTGNNQMNTSFFSGNPNNNNSGTNLFQKPTLSNSTNFFHQNPTNSFFNQNQNAPSSGTNLFNNSTPSNNNPSSFFPNNQNPMTQPQQNLNSTSSSLFKPPGQPSQNNNLISFNSNSYPPTFTTPNQNSFTNNMNAPMQPQTQSFFQQPMQQQFQQQPSNYYTSNQNPMIPNQPQYNYSYNQFPMTQMNNGSFSSYALPSFSQNNQPLYYPPPYSSYPYDQPPIYNPSNTINYSDEYAFDNNDKSFLFAKSKKITNISPYKDIINKELPISDVTNFMSSPWGLKGMLYNDSNTYREDYSLRDVPENISGQYFKDKKMYKNKAEDVRSRHMINLRKKENSVNDDDFDLLLNRRPKRFLESLENEKNQKKGRSISPGNSYPMNNKITDQNSPRSFLPYHVFSIGVSVNVQVNFGDIVKNFSFNLTKQTTLKKVKNFIFKDRCKFNDKMCEELIRHSFFQMIEGAEIAEQRTVEEIGLKNNDEISLLLDSIGLQIYYADKNKDEKKISQPKPEEINKDYLPILTKDGYHTIPKFSDLLTLSKEELEKVPGVTIFNGLGWIEFEDPIDLTYQNLDEIVVINEKFIEVYPDEVFNQNGKKKPNQGEKLNKPAHLTFPKCFLWKNKQSHEVTHRQIEMSLKELALKQDSQLIKYHPQSGQWTLRVKHFTRYGGIIEEEDSVPGDEQNEQSEEESIHSNKSKPTQNNRMVIENHAPYYTDFNAIQEEVDNENGFSEEEIVQPEHTQVSEENEVDGEDFKMNFNENEEINSQEDFPNEKRFKIGQDQFQIVGSPYPIPPMPTIDEKKEILEEKEQTQFVSFKNSHEGMEYGNDTMFQDDFIGDGVSGFSIQGFNKENKEILRKFNVLQNKLRSTLNNDSRSYYQNYSFRPAWCKDGFTSPGVNQCGNYMVNLNKVIIYPEFFNKKGEPTDFNKYYGLIDEYNKCFVILFKTLTEKYDLDSVEKNIQNLSFFENPKEKVGPINQHSWPEKIQFIKRIFLYIHKYVKVLKAQNIAVFQKKFFQEEIFHLGLMNILFGNPQIDFIRFFKSKLDYLNDEKNFLTIHEKIDQYKESPVLDDYLRKILLNKWLEAKSNQGVVGELDFFRNNHLEFASEEEKRNYLQEIVKIYLSGNQIHEAAKFARGSGYPKLSLSLSSLSNKNSRKIMKQGLNLAERYQSMEEFLMNEIYKIAAGDISAFEELELTRWLGVYFWYSPLREESISEIFEEFLKKKQVFNTSFNNTCYLEFSCLLLAYYIKQNMNLFKNKSILSDAYFAPLSDPISYLHPCSSGENPLDRKIIWLFVQFLIDDFQKGNIFESFLDKKPDFRLFYLRLTRNFVSQLEILGLWDLAVIVLIHTPEHFLSMTSKSQWIQQLIHRNYIGEEEDVLVNQKKTKLMQFSISEQYFYEAKAFCYCDDFEWKKAISNFLQAENFLECKEILINQYISENTLMILEGKEDLQKKELKELYGILKTLSKNIKSTEPIKLKMQIHLFENLLKMIEIGLSGKNHVNENFEKSLINLSTELFYSLKKDPVNMILMQKIHVFIVSLMFLKGDIKQDQGLISNKLLLYEKFMRNIDKNETVFENGMKFQKKILNLFGVLEKKRMNAIHG